MIERAAPTTETTRQDNNDDCTFNSTASQRQRILAHLKKHKSITTIEARSVLDILHPAGRIKELIAKGYFIHKIWVQEPTDCGRLHRVARYYLQPGGGHDERV